MTSVQYGRDACGNESMCHASAHTKLEAGMRVGQQNETHLSVRLTPLHPCK